MASYKWRKRLQVGYVYGDWMKGDITFYNLTKCRCMPFMFISKENMEDELKKIKKEGRLK